MSQPLQELLYAAGLSRVQGAILRAAQPSIRLSTLRVAEAELARGTTKFGGCPDLAPGTRWPEYNGQPLPFVAQINLAEAQPCDLNHLLPPTGLLIFFFDVGLYFARERGPVDQTPWWVGYLPSESAILQPAALPASIPSHHRYQPCKVTYATEFTLPAYDPYDAPGFTRLGLAEPLTEEETAAYYHVQHQLAGVAGSRFHLPIHRLLGHADPVQARVDDSLEEGLSGWQLLLQVDSDGAPETEWGDTGRIYYWIRQQDLARRDFSQIQVILQCT